MFLVSRYTQAVSFVRIGSLKQINVSWAEIRCRRFGSDQKAICVLRQWQRLQTFILFVGMLDGYAKMKQEKRQVYGNVSDRSNTDDTYYYF